MHLRFRISRPSLFAMLPLALLLSGCSDPAPFYPSSIASVNGNWQIAATSAADTQLPSISGALVGTGASMSGILHSDSASACVSPSQPFTVRGSTDAHDLTTLTGSVGGGTLTITGTLSNDARSLQNAAYLVKGGSCAFTSSTPIHVTANAFSPITGNYVGSFSDPDGHLIDVTASLTQAPASDPNGNFTLSGSGSFASNPCFNSPVAISNTQVTGGSFNLTYADATTTNTVVVAGTFTPDGTTLNVTNWTLTGPCGPDQGTGTLTKQ